MALTTLDQNVISRGAAAARAILAVYPELKLLNVLFDGTGGTKSTVTQPALDAIASYSGLTTTQLDDGYFALTATIKNDIEAAYTQLVELASRA